MRRLFASFLSLSLALVSCSLTHTSATPSPSPTDQSNILNTPWDDRSLFAAGLVESQRSTLNELDGATVYHLDIQIAEDMIYVTGTEEVRYTNTETVPLDKVELRLFPNILGGEMTISDLTVDEQSVTPAYNLANSLMIVRLAQPLTPNDSVILKMKYAVRVPEEVDMNYGMLAYYKDVLALAHAYPMICVYDDEGWNAEIPSPQGDVTYGDAAFYLVHVTAPVGLTLVTSGREISHDEAGPLQWWNIASGPARDFSLVASLDYEETSRTLGEVTIHSYATKDMQDGAQAALETASKALRVFNERYTLYPYTELDVVATPNSAFGIEYPGMIAITTRIYDLTQEMQNVPVSAILESTVAHEVGHQWFYNLVGDDQLDDPWLDESLTQFVTLQYYSDEYGTGGEQGFRSSLESRWKRVNFDKIPISLPVARYNGAEYGAIVYGRGPLFFEALRDQMGTDTFDAFLKEYTEIYSWGIATPEGLRSLAEKHCNCDLQSLFDQWVY